MIVACASTLVCDSIMIGRRRQIGSDRIGSAASEIRRSHLPDRLESNRIESMRHQASLVPIEDKRVERAVGTQWCRLHVGRPLRQPQPDAVRAASRAPSRRTDRSLTPIWTIRRREQPGVEKDEPGAESAQPTDCSRPRSHRDCTDEAARSEAVHRADQKGQKLAPPVHSVQTLLAHH